MSNNVVQSRDSDGISGQPICSRPSSWIAHWMKPPIANGKLSLEFKSNEDSRGGQEISDLSKYGKVVVPENALKILSNSSRNSNTSIKGSSDSYSPALSTKKVSRLPVDLNSRYNTDTLSAKEIHIQPERTSENFGQLVTYQYFLEKNRLATSRSSNGEFIGSTSNNRDGHVSENLPVQSLMCVSAQISQSDFILAQKKYQNSKTSPTPLLKKTDGGLLQHDTSTSNYQVPDLFGESSRKIQKHPDIRFLPTQISFPQVGRSEHSNNEHRVLKKIPYSLHDLETTRVRTVVESETTRHMFFTRNTDISSSEGAQLVRESAKLNNNNYTDLGSLGQQGLKIQLLDSSTDSDRHRDMGVAKTSTIDSKNESSAETDIMDMAAFKESHNFTDVPLSVSNKECTKGKNVCSPEVGPSSSNCHTDLPDMNEDPPVVAGDPSTSRTHSLDVDRLFSNGENLGSNNPYSRWVKRLKTNGSDSFGHCTKSSKLEDAPSCHKKVNNFFEILKGSKTTSTKPTLDANLGAQQTVSFTVPVKKGKDLMLSHSWVRRWCRNQALPPPKKSEAVVVSAPQSSKSAFDDFQKELAIPNKPLKDFKQFPSIAAMALMGKAMNGFRPCEFSKRGSLLVWNIKEV